MIDNLFLLTSSKKVPDEIKNIFNKNLFFVNYNRVRIGSIFLFGTFLLLILWDILNRSKGLWNTTGYVELFYIHALTALCLLFAIIAMNIYPPQSPESLVVRHKITIITVICITLISAVSTTMVDQYIYGHITAYLIMAFAMGSILLIKDIEGTILYIAAYGLFALFLGKFQKNQDILMGHYVNGAMLTLVAWLFSRLMYRGARNLYIHGKTIENNNEKMQSMAQRLQISEIEHRQLFENSPLGIFRVLEDETIIKANPAMLHILGYHSTDDINQEGFFNLCENPDDRKRLRDLAGKTPILGFETCFRKSDGDIIPVSVTGSLFSNETGEAVYFEGTMEDISPRRHLEHQKEEAIESLRQSEKRYRLLAENSGDMIFTVDREFKMVYVSPAVYRLRGVKPHEAMKETISQKMTPDSFKRLIADYQRILPQIQKGKPPVSQIEVELYHKNGSTLWTEFTMRPIQDCEGELSGFIGVVHDISKRKQAEEDLKLMNIKLRTSEMEYRNLFEHSPTGIFRTDFNGHLLEANPAALRIMKYTNTDEINSTGLNNLFESQEDRNRLVSLAQQGTISGFETDIRRGDGQIIPLSINVFLETDEEDNPLNLEGTFEDISERRLMDKVIRESEEQFRSLFEGSRDAILMTNRNEFVDCNSAALQLYGLTSKDQILSKGPADFSPPLQSDGKDSLESSKEKIDTALKEGGLFFEWTHKRRDGTIFPAEVLLSRIDYRGKTIVQTVVRDITERKQTEVALRESEQRLADIIDFLPIATFVIDRESRVTAWNRAMEAITNVPASEITGRGDHEYALPFYGKKQDILIDLVFTDEEKLDERYRHIHRENGILTAEAFIPELGKEGIILVGHASALRDAEGNVTGAIESIRDVTAIRKAETELREARNIAENANRSKSIFLANMSHEIRTPMNAILGYAQLMRRDQNLSTLLQEYLEIINKSGEHLLSLINDILEMSKIEAGRSVITAKTFDLHGLLDDLEMMFRIQAEEKGLRLLVERVDDLPRWIITDEAKLRQVLVNLLGNAMKFTSEGGVALRICARDQNGETMELLTEVEDTGPGITVAETERLFNLFEQTNAGLKNGGTGLGLALSRGFVELLGGELTVNSVVDKGSVFRFNIQVKEGKEKHSERNEIKQRVMHLKDEHVGMRVLIADDQKTNCRLLTRMLANIGFETREVENGALAVEAFSQWQPRVILMDMTMPVMDGYEATRRIKADPRGKNTAIVAVTASAFEEHRKVMLSAGVNGYLAKPFREEELFTVLKELTGADYVYEGQTSEETGKETVINIQEIVSKLPSSLMQQLREATVSADLDLINELLEKTAKVSPPAYKKLREMAARYEYEKLLNLFSQGV